MSQALFDKLEVTGDVLLVWSGHQQLGAHWGTWERQELSPQCVPDHDLESLASGGLAQEGHEPQAG